VKFAVYYRLKTVQVYSQRIRDHRVAFIYTIEWYNSDMQLVQCILL